MTDAVDDEPLPSGWARTTLGSVLADIQPGFASGQHSSDGRGLPHLRPMNVSRQGHIDRSDLRFVAADLADRPARRLRRGDVLFNNTNSLELVGKTALFDGDDEPAFSNHMTRLRIRDGLADPAFIAQLLHARWRLGDFQRLANNHVSQASVGRGVLIDLPIALPTPAEQRRVAEYLGEIETRRSTAAVHLEAARGVVGHFRTALLAAACAGRLTPDWRESHPNTPSVKNALASVVIVKRHKLAPHGDDLTLPELPETYVVSTIGAASLRIEYGTSRRADLHGEIPVLRMGNIQNGRLVVSELKYLDMDAETAALALEDGDLLFNRTNSPGLVGKSAVFHGTDAMTFASYLIRVRLAPEVADPDFVNYWLSSLWGRQWARNVKTDGVSQSNINGTKLSAMPLPLPPLEEQREIVRRVEAMLDSADRLAAQIDHTAATLERVSRVCLAKAFRGDLLSTGAAAAQERGRVYELEEPARITESTRPGAGAHERSRTGAERRTARPGR